MTVGNETGSNGFYDFQGGALITPELIVGRRGSGDFGQSGGQANVSGNIYIGYEPGGSGWYDLCDSPDARLICDGTVYVGYDGPGVFVQDNGSPRGRHVGVGLRTGKVASTILAGGVLSPQTINLRPGGVFRPMGGILSGGDFNQIGGRVEGDVLGERAPAKPRHSSTTTPAISTPGW